MSESVESALTSALTANVTSAALAMRAAEHSGADWREGVEVEDETMRRLRAMSTAGPSLDEAMTENLITLDAENRGVPRSRRWTEHAIAHLEQAAEDERVELEQLGHDLAVERELRAERQAVADAARAEYLALAQGEYAPVDTSIVATVGGRRVAVRTEDASDARQMVLWETRGADHPSPVAQAYHRWRRFEAEIVRGAEHDPRVVRLADGREQVRETAIVERMAQLRHVAGVRASRVGQLRNHLERLAEPPAPPVTVMLRDTANGTQSSITLPARWIPVRL